MRQTSLAFTWLIVLLIAGFESSLCVAQTSDAQSIPDLTKGTAPSAEEIKKDWYLHCGDARGWAWRDAQGGCDSARQIYITKVPATSPVRYDLKVGDVILGVNGKPFSGQPIFEFRKASMPANASGGKLDVVLWRQGWDQPKNVTLDLSSKPIDFTKGDQPGDETDWNLGPTGARGWMQGFNHESFMTRQILITLVEKGSPADGILEKGDAILGIGDTKFDSDARRRLGEAITQAETETGKGELKLLRWRDGQTQTVTLKLPVLGSYSDTTPWDCPKSRAILKNACDYIVKNDLLNRYGDMDGRSHVAALALMSTGDEELMALAKTHVEQVIQTVMQNPDNPPQWGGYSSWGWGYTTVMLCEYYLLTHDENTLPPIRILSELIARGQSGVGSWGHRMTSNHGALGGYGALNQAGNMCMMSLVLAQRCGVTSPEIEQAVERGSTFLAQFIDMCSIPYGDHPDLYPTGHDDNGKSSQGAVIFAIKGDERKTDFFSRMTVASYAVRERGHTGNYFSMLWGPLGAARAEQAGCSAFLREQEWYFDLERRWDGGFSYQGKMGFGYGVNPNTGRQYIGAEHQYAGWDTTCARVLMYTLPMKRLAIQGRDVMTVQLPDAVVAQLIEDGQRPARDNQAFTQRYDDQGVDELLKLLTSWSPVVRSFAAMSLAKKETAPPIPALVEMLHNDNRYARYGACVALRQLASRAGDAVDPLIASLGDDDPLFLAHAACALEAIGDRRAIAPLLKLAARQVENDPAEITLRFTGKALCDRNGLLSESLDGVDRGLLDQAIRRLLKCRDGSTRGLLGNTVLNKLSFEELQPLWPDMIQAMNVIAPSGVMFASGVRLTVAQTLAKYHVEEGVPLILGYATKQNGWGSNNRSPQIIGLLKQYGASAQPMLPEIDKYLEYVRGKTPRNSDGSLSNKDLYGSQIAPLTEAMESIRTSKDKPELRSIKPYLGDTANDLLVAPGNTGP